MPQRVWWILGDQCYHWFSFPKETHFVIWESEYFLKRFQYHHQKIWFLYSSLRYFSTTQEKKGYQVTYYSLGSKESKLDMAEWVQYLFDQGVRSIDMFVTSSFELSLIELIENTGIKIIWHHEAPFVSSRELKQRYFEGKNTFQFLPFYKTQRQNLGILLDEEGPQGGKWTYDTENRKSLPKDITLPKWEVSHTNEEQIHIESVLKDLEPYKTHSLGSIQPQLLYLISPKSFWKWYQKFLDERFHSFGTYEDAIDRDSHTVFHSVISMNLNIGMIHPTQIIKKTLDYYDTNQKNVSLNQVEGFLRQVIGWREYIKNIYDVRGPQMKGDNFFRFTRVTPDAFWKANTGLLPVDTTIQKVLDTGYAHHIERLMILGNIMLLCEINPKEVNNWFQSLFVDAYEWAMLPNVIGMSQFADGGRMMTKPYISGSNYILKMSNYQKDGYWEVVWDALFWRFVSRHERVLKDNARMYFTVAQWQKKDVNTQTLLLDRAEHFLTELS